MWCDRYTVYYSKDQSFMVRWLSHGRPENEAQYKKFDDRVKAERFYNELVATLGDERVELFYGQTKWVCYSSNHNEFGELIDEPLALKATDV